MLHMRQEMFHTRAHGHLTKAAGWVLAQTDPTYVAREESFNDAHIPADFSGKGCPSDAAV